MAKRLKFIRGADEFVDRGVTFVKGGPGQEVEDDRAAVLENLAGYDFDEETNEEYQERVAAAEKLTEEERIAEESQAEARQAEIDAAQRTADFFNANSVAEQEAKGVTDDAVSRPATASEEGDQSVPEAIEDEDEDEDEISEDVPTVNEPEKRSRNHRFE